MTTKEAFQKYRETSEAIEKFDDESAKLTEEQYDVMITKLIEKQNDSVLGIVNTCGRTVFDSCQRRMTDCGNCVGHSLFKHRQNWRN